MLSSISVVVGSGEIDMLNSVVELFDSLISDVGVVGSGDMEMLNPVFPGPSMLLISGVIGSGDIAMSNVGEFGSEGMRIVSLWVVAWFFGAVVDVPMDIGGSFILTCLEMVMLEFELVFVGRFIVALLIMLSLVIIVSN